LERERELATLVERANEGGRGSCELPVKSVHYGISGDENVEERERGKERERAAADYGNGCGVGRVWVAKDRLVARHRTCVSGRNELSNKAPNDSVTRPRS
jgi:hypothetical protein